MIANIKSLEIYCKDYKNIENYEEAMKSPFKYDLHHRREIAENKSRKDLKDKNLYFHRPATELIFLEHGEHQRLHKEGENNPMFGKNMSAETRQKMSNAKKGKPSPNRGKAGTCLGKHWHLENGHRIWTE